MEIPIQPLILHFFKFFGLWEPLTPQEFPIPSVGGVWIFSRTTHYVTAAIISYPKYSVSESNVNMTLLYDWQYE